MKLVRYGAEGREKPGLIDGAGCLRDLSAIIADIDGAALAPAALARIRAAAETGLPAVEGSPRLGSCVARPSAFIAIGLNYSHHAREIGMPFPDEPVIFLKASNCISGPHDPLPVPPGSTKLDWEVEIAIVIGTGGYCIEDAAALTHIAGFCLCNDVSERAFQLERGPTWTKGKSAPGFGPLGPWLATSDGIANPAAIGLWLDVDGERMQSGTTADMIFGFARCVAGVSQFMALEPGDVILTGTPAGVGKGRVPERYLKPGEVVTLGADGLGEQRHTVIARR